MSKILNDPAELKKFRAHLVKFNKTIDDEFKRMKQHHKSLREHWDDDMYKQFGKELDDATKGISAYLKSHEKYEQHLAKLIQKLEEVQQTRVR